MLTREWTWLCLNDILHTCQCPYSFVHIKCRNVHVLRERVLILPHLHAVSITCRFSTRRFYFCTLHAVSLHAVSMAIILHADSVIAVSILGFYSRFPLHAVSTAIKTSYTPFPYTPFQSRNGLENGCNYVRPHTNTAKFGPFWVSGRAPARWRYIWMA